MMHYFEDPSPVYDLYWKFASERLRIYYLRLSGERAPWTKDEVMSTYRFTNVFRAADRTSQYLIKNVIYDDKHRSPEDICLRILLFKMFNSIDTWTFLESQFGDVNTKTFSVERYGSALLRRQDEKTPLYSSAYIMPSGKTSFGYKRKALNHLSLVQLMLDTRVSLAIARAKSLRDVYGFLVSYPVMGRFLSYQICIDLNYSELCDFDENSFVVAGPGAISGVVKCFGKGSACLAERLIHLTMESQSREFYSRGLEFDGLFGRPLHLVDCQNLFCEVNKYARVAMPNVEGTDGRGCIKRKYRGEANPLPIPFFPPKWGLNERVGTCMKKLTTSEHCSIN